MSAPNQSSHGRARRAADLSRLFKPSAIAVFGVSKDPEKLGTRTFRNVCNGGFGGAIFPIGRDLDNIDGRPAYASIADVPQVPDVVFMALPAQHTVRAVKECAQAGVGFAIIGASGFAESNDAEGLARQAELEAIVDEYGIRLVGPNCNGIYSTSVQLAIGFNTGHSRRLARGNIGIVSHSGALFDPMLQLMAPLGGAISSFVSCGNQGDLNVLDYMEYLVGDSDTQVIALLLDSLPDGGRFRALATRARQAGKAVIALKIGITEVGARAATAHSSRLTGNEAAYRALFAASGVATAASLEGFIAGAVLLSRFGYKNSGLSTISTSGAGCSLIADIACRHGLHMPDYSEATKAAIAPHQRFAEVANPTDVGVFGSLEPLPDVARIIAADEGIGVLLIQMHRLPLPALARFAETAASALAGGIAVVALAPGDLTPAERKPFEDRNVPVFTDTEMCVQGVAALAMTAPVLASASTGMRQVKAAHAGALSEPDSLALLAEFGVATVGVMRCDGVDAALAAAQSLGWPVVVKGVADGVAHKSEAGLVHVNIADQAALRAAVAKMPACELIVQPMIRGVAEAIVGVSRTPDCGLLLIAGLGGIFAEALRDVATWALPVDRAALEHGIDACALGRVLDSPRWDGVAARAQLIDILLQLQEFALSAGDVLEAVDINPVILAPNRATAVDALVIFRDGAAPEQQK